MAGKLSTTELIGQLLAQAESAGTPEERDTFYAAAQTKATRQGIDLAVARASIAKLSEREKPTHKHIVLGVAKQRALSWHVELFSRIASTNDLEITMAMNSTYVNLYGMPSDIEVAQAIYNSCVVAMVQGGDNYLREGTYRDELLPLDVKKRRDNPRAGEWGWWKGTSRGEVYVDGPAPKYEYYWVVEHKPISGLTARQNFYKGFVYEIGKRLRTAKREAEAAVLAESAAAEHVEAQSTSTALVLKEKSKEVAEFYQERLNGKKLKSYQGSRSPVSHYGASNAGSNAAKGVDLGGRKALPGPRTQIKA